MKVERCKGFRDLLPDDMRRFRAIEETFRKTCLNWGYQEVKTPSLEYLYLFTSTGTLTPSLLSRVYSFLDWDGWSGERVVLRPDGTIPIARMYSEKMINENLAKLFYITNIFIFEETGTVDREKWQGGVELIGAGSFMADIELILMALEILHKLGIRPIQLRLSHAGMIKAVLAGLGFNHEEQTKIFDQVLDGDFSILKNLSPEKSNLGKTITSLLELEGNSSALLKNLRALYAVDLPDIINPLNNFIDITAFLENAGINFSIDIRSGRGFEYYTGLVFHLYADGVNVGGGGRYDDLIPFMSGKNIPASGFALYIDRLMEIIKPEYYSSTDNNIMVAIKPCIDKPNTARCCKELVDVLHDAEIITEMELSDQTLKAAVWEIEIGGDSTYILKNNTQNTKFQVNSIEDIIKIINNHEQNNQDSTA